MNGNIRFTDGKGNPVSHEYFESIGFTDGLKIPGQMMVSIKVKTGVVQMACRCEKEEEFIQLAKLMYKEFVKESK